MTLLWGPLIVGILAIAAGIAIIANRVRLAKFNADGNRQVNGRLGDRVAASSTPRLTAVIGGVFILIGISAAVFALVP